MSVMSIGALVLVAFVSAAVMGVLAGIAWLGWKVIRGVAWLVARVFRFVGRELGDAVHVVGAMVTGAAMVPLTLVNTLILRFGAARHYGRAALDEVKSVLVGLWRIGLANPLRLVGCGAVVDGIERRLPEAIERAPRRSRGRRATFEGYDVIGTLPSGGSGAQLFVARPRSATVRRHAGAGRALPMEVVIKSFALETGSTLPQIVRESRALEAASRLGLVLEHQLSDEHFYYVMPYVKGEDLDRVVRGLHSRASLPSTGEGGLGERELQQVLGYAIDILDTLERFHSGGLWHKDVKPANVIVSKGRAHLVDFGLVTPLASAMTLTTHGTEYYRDPEMVRLALQGVKVHEVDGCKFDLYSAGAVLYSMVENSFPAHGSLSKITRSCPEALRWIVQRAMSEMGTRYGSARDMRADLAALVQARDAFALKPADLPSFGRVQEAGQRSAEPAAAYVDGAAQGSGLRRVAEGVEQASFSRRIPREPLVAAAAAPAPSFRPRRRHGLAPLALAMAGLFGLFFLTSAAFLMAGRSRQAAAHVYQESRFAHLKQVPRWSRFLRAEDVKALELARGVVEDLGEDAARSAHAGVSSEKILTGHAMRMRGADPRRAVATVLADSAEEILQAAIGETVAGDLAEEGGAAGPPGQPSAGRILVLDDLATSVDPRALELLERALAERGFTVVGNEPGEEAQARAVELIAAARHAIGLGRLDETETQDALQAFLDASTELDGLILVSRAEDEHSHVYRVLVRGEGPDPASR